MKFNFDEIIPRKGTNSIKWDSADNEEVLPMWVSDMDFQTVPAVVEAIIKRAKHGIFGYTKASEVYFDAVMSWYKKRYDFTIKKDYILHTIGVVPALTVIIKALTESDDKVIIQTPVYNCFFSSVRNNGCIFETNELICKNGAYQIDYNDLEKKSSDPKTKLMLLCSPHNPVGRVWKHEELKKIGEICLQNNVIVVSDEIHCDIVYQGHKHIPFASINDDFLQNSVTCSAPSKTFNLASIQIANIIVANTDIRSKIRKALHENEIHLINAFAAEALIAAYSEGEEWLDELKEYLYENYITLLNFFKQYLPHLKVFPLEATYLVWIDCSALKITSKEIAKTLLEKGKLWIQSGDMYGAAGEGFIRINIGTQRETLMKGLNIIKEFLST